MRKAAVPRDVKSYLAAVPPRQRAALERLRKIIRAAAPCATEMISYDMPSYKYLGALVYFAAFQKHCSFFPASSRLIRTYQVELAGFETSKGTIRFTPEKPIPAALVRKIVRARVQENEARRKKS